MRLNNFITHLVSSLLSQLLISVMVLLTLIVMPWGSVLRMAGFVQGDPEEQFEKVAEALQANQGQGFDPIQGPTGVPAPGPPPQPEESAGPSVGTNPFAGLWRKIGFGDDTPEWVPVFPGAIDDSTIRQATPEGEKSILRFTVRATGPGVVNFYERAFTRMGYTFTRELKGSETSFAAESPDGRRDVSVAIIAQGDLNSITIACLERPNPGPPPVEATPAEYPPASEPNP